MSEGRTQSELHAAHRLKVEFFQIALAVLGIIQGFSLNQLAEKFARGGPNGAASIYDSVNIFSSYCHFTFCLLALIRVFQTYLLATLDYKDWRASFIDLVSIFIVGIIEFWVFEVLTGDPNFEGWHLHARARLLIGAAILLHALVVLSLWRDTLKINGGTSGRRREIWLQVANCALPAAGFAACQFSVHYKLTGNNAAFVSLALIVLIAINIALSLTVTLKPAMPRGDD